MLRSLRAGLFAAIAIVAALAPATIASASPPASYLSIQPAEILFMEVTVSKGNVTAELYDDTLTGSAPNLSLHSGQSSLSGTDTSRSLTLSDGLGNTIFGFVNSHSLSLGMPQSDGALETVVFHETSATVYNRELSQLQQHVSEADAATSKVDNDLSVIASSGTLGTDELLANDERVLDNDVSGLRYIPNSVSGAGSECSNIMAAYPTADTAYPRAVSVVLDAQSRLLPDLSEVQKVLVAAPADWKVYDHAQNALTGYHFGSIPPLATVVNAGQALIVSGVADVNSDIGKANHYVAEVYAIVDSANEKYQCGPLQTTPPAIKNVTAGSFLSDSGLTGVVGLSVTEYRLQLSAWNRWVSAANALDKDLAIMRSPYGYKAPDAGLSGELSSVQLALWNVRMDKGEFVATRSPGLTCSFIEDAYSYARAAHSAGLSMVSQATSGFPAAGIRAEATAMAAAPADWAAYWRGQQALPGYRNANPPPPLPMTLTAGTQFINGLVSSVNSYIDKANQDVAEAYAIVNPPEVEYHCGPSFPVPIIPPVTLQSFRSD